MLKRIVQLRCILYQLRFVTPTSEAKALRAVEMAAVPPPVADRKPKKGLPAKAKEQKIVNIRGRSD